MNVDELIAIEEAKSRTQIEKVSKLDALKQKEEKMKQKKAKLKALKEADSKREAEIQTKVNEISEDHKGEAQSIALAPINTNASPTDADLSKQFNDIM